MCFSHGAMAGYTVVDKTDVLIALCAFCPARETVSDLEHQASVKMLG